MLSTITISESLFPELHDAVLREWNPNVSREQWQRAFVRRWNGDDDHFGYALTDGGRIVGVLGMLFSQRTLAGRTARFCNLHCWRVKPEYRANSLALLKPLQSLKDCTITDFTPGAGVSAITKRLGFKPLDSTVFVMPPMLSRSKRTIAMIREIRGAGESSATTLNPVDRQIYDDHQNIDCGHMVVSAGQEYCYVVYSRIAQHPLPYCLVNYLSNPKLFVDHHTAIRGHLLKHSNAQFAVVEARLLGESHLPLAFRASAHEKLYRSSDVSPQQIDTLYSEVVLFKHSPLPSLRQRLRATAKRYIPPAIQKYVGITSPA